MLKRIFDVVLALSGLLITWPLFLIVAVLIKLDSKGPIFFKQERVGKDGKIFKIYKFRTMIENAEKVGSKLTRKNDSRITQIGYLLRWLKIDELPQLINVLKGEMSLIGPRPEIPSIVEHYSDKEREVLSVRPGIVGPSQILGRDEVEKYPEEVEDSMDYYIKHILPEKLAIDLRYVKDVSIFKDIKYIFLGLWVTIFGSLKLKYLSKKRSRIYLLLMDITLGLLSYSLAYLLRFSFFIPQSQLSIFFSALALITLIRPPIFIYFGLYQSLTRYTGPKDFISIFKAVTIGSLLTLFSSFLLDIRALPRSVVIIDWFLLNFFLCGVRILRMISLQNRDNNKKIVKKNLLIVGAGDTGELILRGIERNPELGYNVVGFIDDDPQKVGMIIHGVKVLGRRYDIPEVVSVKGVDEVLLAIPETTAEGIREICGLCKRTGVNYKILPTIRSIINGKGHISKISPVEVSDFHNLEMLKRGIDKLLKMVQDNPENQPFQPPL